VVQPLQRSLLRTRRLQYAEPPRSPRVRIWSFAVAACSRVCCAAIIVSSGSEPKMSGALCDTYVIRVQIAIIHKAYSAGIKPIYPRPIVHLGTCLPFQRRSVARVGAIGTEVCELVPRRYIPTRSFLDIVANDVIACQRCCQFTRIVPSGSHGP
jgi:hypothetical protein